MKKVGLLSIADYLREMKLKLMTADKEVFIVVLTKGQFVEKASDALANNSHFVGEKPKRVKERAKGLLQELNLDCLSRAVTKAGGLCLDVFFYMKTHKPE